MFKALSDPIRLRLLSLIASTSDMSVCDLTDAFDVTGATISHHLRVLREADLVDSERRGTWVYYRTRKPTLDLLGGLLLAPVQEPATETARDVAPPAVAGQQDDPPHQLKLKLISSDFVVLRLFADPLRAEIVRLLADGSACTSHLVADTGAKQPNVSGHIKLLREAGVVVGEPHGRCTFYRLAPEALQGVALQLAGLAAQARANSENFRDS